MQTGDGTSILPTWLINLPVSSEISKITKEEESWLVISIYLPSSLIAKSLGHDPKVGLCSTNDKDPVALSILKQAIELFPLSEV